MTRAGAKQISNHELARDVLVKRAILVREGPLAKFAVAAPHAPNEMPVQVAHIVHLPELAVPTLSAQPDTWESEI